MFIFKVNQASSAQLGLIGLLQRACPCHPAVHPYGLDWQHDGTTELQQKGLLDNLEKDLHVANEKETRNER